jgi:hypothetical protein
MRMNFLRYNKHHYHQLMFSAGSIALVTEIILKHIMKQYKLNLCVAGRDPE